MTRREVVAAALRGEGVPYTPWSFGFTLEARELLEGHYGGGADLLEAVGNHIVDLGRDIGLFEDLGGDRWRDSFGVVWNRTIDKDIGNVERIVLPEPTLANYTFPDPLDPRLFIDVPGRIERYGDRYRLYCIGFSLYERAWTMRGMENLLLDFREQPEFVHELFTTIADYNIAQAHEALKYDIDAVYFGDDWGQQRGLIMGYDLWKTFILPQLRRMYDAVRSAGKTVFIHSCGDVDELFGDLIDAGVNCFNPFQPEVMDTAALFEQYRGRLSFWGGLSTQRTLPRADAAGVRAEAERLLEMGRGGSYIFSPAHAVEDDVPLENILAFIEVAQAQPGAPAR